MKNKIITGLAALLLFVSCKDDEKILNSLADYNASMETKGYHFGDKLDLPKDVLDNAENITISFGEKETSNLVIDSKYFTLGDNAVTFNIKTKSGETLYQDATINVFTKIPVKNINYEVVAEYPHNPANFVQGFQIEGNTIYESDGQQGSSQILKYNLGDTKPILSTKQPEDIFSEGSTIVGDKIYQLTWQNKKGFVYNKNSLSLLSEFPYPDVMGEGWGLTYDGKNLIASDGTKNLYFLNANDPSKVVRYISVAGNTEVYDQLNELEYYKGFIYANVWHKPIILKINPANGEVVGKFDFTKITDPFTKANSEYVLNGIAFKDDHMVITGKNWSKIYEVAIK
ncbi:glutaminyl-peptide cyclotransferase [Chryseobacterium chendengshani]|uniref:glutaminyl-peptide cyclotransferase n=1 Tax=Chryseobacterium sp. LJ668 TaxID=2864040 RepID=UPI001C68C001|nr:glutaminyl-peptide cyclotransferase [Chryseobacterium sp. LJ668]MBW8523559.1 glutaminyl-peptide cyclotransferase [Chryseobacterium sp. LJ668]QYK15842.1 glutaminyl-peptide cyclotransferase [Chryseobacterium sp. LJ668]